MKRAHAAIGLLLSISAAAPIHAAPRTPKIRSARRSFSINLRRRINTQPLITDPGTIECDWNFFVSNHAGELSVPATIRITPEGRHIWWGRSEFSVNLDALENIDTGDHRVNQFSDRVGLAMTSVLVDSAHFSLAGGPQASFLLRGDHGARLGAFLIGRTDWGRNSAGFTLNWTGATAASDTNQAGTFDVGFGGGRRLAESGLAGHLTVHGNYLYERSSGTLGFHSIFEGIETQINDRVSIDLSAQHVGLGGGGGAVDHQFLAGLTVNLGRYRH